MARHRARSPLLIALRVLIAAVAVGAGLVALLAPSVPGAAGASSSAGPGAGRPSTAVPAVVLAADPTADGPRPVAVRVPSVGLEGSVVPVAVDSSGTLAPPEDTAQAGWFAEGPAPGEIGPAVLAGHVDSWRGPGIFFRLGATAPGAEVLVDRADGSTLRFTVTRVARYPKSAFPTAEVYGPTPDAELRLITCGGQFDRSARSYVDNVVVYARHT